MRTPGYSLLFPMLLLLLQSCGAHIRIYSRGSETFARFYDLTDEFSLRYLLIPLRVHTTLPLFLGFENVDNCCYMNCFDSVLCPDER